MVKKVLIILFVTILFGCQSQVKEANKPYKSEFSELVAIKGHDPVEEGVLTSPALKDRLTKLLGEGKYDTLVTIMHECTPIGFNNDIVYWMGYSKDYPATTGAAVIIDLNEDIIYVAYEIDDIMERFSEAGDVRETPTRLQLWLNRRDRPMLVEPETIISEEEES